MRIRYVTRSGYEPTQEELDNYMEKHPYVKHICYDDGTVILDIQDDYEFIKEGTQNDYTNN